jgi:hypothetical protein
MPHRLESSGTLIKSHSLQDKLYVHIILAMIIVIVHYTHFSFVVKQAVQLKGSIRRFSIDPNDYSNFEIANHLWSLMETGTYAASIASE